MENGLRVVFCCGETLAQREANEAEKVVFGQLDSLKGLSKEQWKNIVLAYEPVWAIGTGKVASPAQAQEAHAFIRKWVGESVGAETANAVQIIYGGSVKPANCEELIQGGDIDGFLIGGASLKASFAEIIGKVTALI